MGLGAASLGILEPTSTGNRKPRKTQRRSSEKERGKSGPVKSNET